MVFDFGQSVDQSMNFGLMNALRTGNLILDTIVVMLIPVVMRGILALDVRALFAFIPAFFGKFLKGRVEHIRRIEFVEAKRANIWDFYGNAGALENINRNDVLQRAIRLYIGEKYPELKENMMTVRLVPDVSAKKKAKNQKSKGNNSPRSDDGDNHDNFYKRAEELMGSNYKQLSQYKVSMLPMEDAWFELETDLYFMHTSDEMEDEADRKAREGKGGGEDSGKLKSRDNKVVYKVWTTSSIPPTTGTLTRRRVKSRIRAGTSTYR